MSDSTEITYSTSLGESESGEDIQLVPLHRHNQYTEDCLDMLTAHWKMKRETELLKLQDSVDDFPTSLVLLKYSGDGRINVIGYSRLKTIPFKEQAIWIEKVIINTQHRGKGYGNILMDRTEEYAHKRNFKSAYLSTGFQHNFYTKLGYVLCPSNDPIQAWRTTAPMYQKNWLYPLKQQSSLDD
ncbi:unnamed protein product [Meganyctiphanes norvegica]|uniref:N-acetyltransferase domain-containing protein n=1 Tax=Meganyctiphanes norvegica TaxID=48144 RepID=A0AAV2SAX7_MEGNR